MLAIGITTAPRKHIYLNQTVQQLRYEFPDAEICIFAEPGTPKTVEATWVYNSERLGVGYNWLSGFNKLLHCTTVPWLMMCEDDIYLSIGFGPKICHLLQSPHQLQGPIGFISPYCSYVNARPSKPGWSLAKRSPWGWCGMLCTIWPRDSAYITDCKFNPEWGTDACIGDYVIESGRRIYVHTPTLVSHVGEYTTFKRTDPNAIQRQAYDGFHHPVIYRNR